MLTETLVRYSPTDFAADVRTGLTLPGQKELPSKYLYDEIGSSLFEVIVVLPEYGVYRAEDRLLRRCGDDAVRLLSARPVAVAELGSGSGRKARSILESLNRRQETTYYPIEISPTSLVHCAKEFRDLPHVSVVGLEQSYLDGLRYVSACRRRDENLLVLFLGSTIGNFDPPADEQFLGEVRRTLQCGDALLLGTDLEKPLSQILPAYDDSLGVTAAFNRNILTRANRELRADFDVSEFRHVIRYDKSRRRVEMHLQVMRDQQVSIPEAELNVSFLKGETIWTESSYKYRLQDVGRLALRSGFRIREQWLDEIWPFAQTLMIPC
jgi:L-histidine N-alpha-methyltransferase